MLEEMQLDCETYWTGKSFYYVKELRHYFVLKVVDLTSIMLLMHNATNILI